MDNVTAFIEWWASLTPAERRERLRESKARRSYWMERRARVLFGLLESDSLFGTLETTELIATLPPQPLRQSQEDQPCRNE